VNFSVIIVHHNMKGVSKEPSETNKPDVVVGQELFSSA